MSGYFVRLGGCRGIARRIAQALPHDIAMMIDLFALARSAQHIQAELPIAKMQRLETPSRSGSFRWQANGSVNRDNKFFVDLEMAGEIVLICQRCLEPVSLVVTIKRHYLIARNDREADAVSMDDDETEVIVGAKNFDMDALIEDEIILSLPLVPKHEVCPRPLLHATAGTLETGAASNATAEIEASNDHGKPSAFAVLAGLKPQVKN